MGRGPTGDVGARRGLTVRFPALENRNFRCYAIGQMASIGGTWLQNVSLSWLVLESTDSGAAVGLVGAAQFLPALLLGAWAGALADRFEARNAVLVLQVVLGAQACTLAAFVFAGTPPLGLLVGLALWQGVGAAFDPPVRQGLMNDLVGETDLPNAVAMNSALVQLGLIVGPALAAFLIDTVGIAWCFAVNSMSYVVMFVAIAAIRPAELHRRPRAAGADASVRAGLVYLRGRSDIRALMAAILLCSLVSFRLEVLLPVLARELGGGSGLFSALTATRGAGALLASLWLAGRVGASSVRTLRVACVLMAGSLTVMAIPHPVAAFVALVPAGVGMMTVVVGTLAGTQVLASPEYRGRVVAVWFVAINGGVVGGSLFSGWLAQRAGTSTAFLVGAAVLVAVSVAVLRPRDRRQPVGPFGNLSSDPASTRIC